LTVGQEMQMLRVDTSLEISTIGAELLRLS